MKAVHEEGSGGLVLIPTGSPPVAALDPAG